MKNKIVLIFGFVLFGISQTFCMDKDTLIGKVVSIHNPCTTDPCLPGGVIALQTDSMSYILTINHQWNIDEFSIDDSIQVIGVINKKVDLQNQIYYEIEVDTAFFLVTSVNFLDHNIFIYPNPSNGTFFIKSDVINILGVEITDINGKNIYFQNNSSTNNIVIDGITGKGVHILKVLLSNNRLLTQKIVIQ